MKKENNQPASINLLRKHNESVFDQIFSWALNVGRLLIIITQFVALGAFLFRFSLDRQIIDLNDEITKKQVELGYRELDEKKYRALMARLNSANLYQEQATEQEKILGKIVDTARGKMEFVSLNASSESISIEGTTSSVGLLQKLINEYKIFPGVKSVSITSIITESKENRIRSTFSLSFKDVDIVNPLITNL